MSRSSNQRRGGGSRSNSGGSRNPRGGGGGDRSGSAGSGSRGSRGSGSGGSGSGGGRRGQRSGSEDPRSGSGRRKGGGAPSRGRTGGDFDSSRSWSNDRDDRDDRGDGNRGGPDRNRGRTSGGGGGRSSKPRGLGGDQIEGRQAIRELLIAGRRRVTEILMASDLDPAPILDEIVELAREDRVVVREIGRSKLESIARTAAPQGIIAKATPLEAIPLDSLISGDGDTTPFLLALDGVTDPGNLGTLLRTAEGAGVTGVIIPKHRAAHITPAVAKAAAGAIEYLPMAHVGGLASTMMDLSREGVWSLGLDGAGETSLFDVKIPDVPVVVVLGAEGSGLSRLVGERCDQLAAIPRLGNLESLNVASAGAVACYEVARSRLR